jgi:DNA repair protein RecO (recombination protein O)
MIQSSDTIVLKTISHGDTSKIVICYTKNFGQVKLIAKGARSKKSPHKNLFFPGRHINISYYEKPNRELLLFKSGELLSSFNMIEKDLDRMTFSQVMMDLLDHTMTHSESQESIYKLTLTALQNLNQRDIPVYWTYWSFHLQLLSHLGFHFETDICHQCQSTITTTATMTHHQELLCDVCNHGALGFIPLTKRILKTMKALLNEEKAPYESYTKIERQTLWKFLWQYTHFHLESTRYMKSLEVLQQIYGTL